MHLLVTGGAGFIGSNFVNQIAREGSAWTSITVLDSLTYAASLENLRGLIENEKINFIHGNILDESLLNSVLKKIDVVINFAAESHVDNSITNPGIFVETNVLGTHKLLNASRVNRVQTFIQVSTDEVYGSIVSGSWTEESPLRPNSPYSASKASADLLCLAFFKTYGMDIRITRCSNNYGPRQYPEKLIPYFVSLLKMGKKVPLYGNGLNVRDWLHVDDHCQGILNVVTNGEPGEIYNIGGGQELTNLELVERLLLEMNLTNDYINYVDDRKGHDFRYSLDYTKAKESLGYSPQVDFSKGFSDTIAWYLSQV